MLAFNNKRFFILYRNSEYVFKMQIHNKKKYWWAKKIKKNYNKKIS